MRKMALVLIFAALLVVTASAEVAGRYIRYEAPMSPHMMVSEIEVFSGGRNVAPEHRDGLSAIWADNGQNPVSPEMGKLLTDGIILPQKRPCQFDGSSHYRTTSPFYKKLVINPVLELDLGKMTPIEKIVVSCPPYTGEYQDKYWRIIVVLDEDRKVVASKEYRIIDQPYKSGVQEFIPEDGKGALAGQTAPAGVQQWVSPADVMGCPPASEPGPAQKKQIAEFAKRNSPEGIAKLAQQFFSRMDLSKPELANIKKLYEEKKYQAALDAFRTHFFERVKRMDGAWVYPSPVFFYSRQADDMTKNILVNIGHGSLATAKRFIPGAIDWTGDAELVWINKFQKPLLIGYRRTGKKEYLDKWAELTDDWAMHYSEQADASPKNERDLFVMTPFNHLNEFFKDLYEISQERPDIVKDISSATLARTLMFVLEEYPPAYWRVCRQCSFNHTFNGWGQTVLPGYILNDFYAGQRLALENRQHFERLWESTGMTRDGSMIELGDRGHMGMPFASMGQYFALKENKYDWYTPLHDALYRDRCKNLSRFLARQLVPGEDNFSFFWGSIQETVSEPQDKNAAITEANRMPGIVTYEVMDDPDLRAMLKGKAVIAPSNQEQYQKTLKRLKEDTPDKPSFYSDWMPYAGLHFLRRGWDKDDSYIYMRGQSMDGPGCGQSDNTFLIYADYQQNLFVAEPVTIDGQKQDIFDGTQRLFPGSKTAAIAKAPEKPIDARWHSSEKYDLAEAFFKGTYQTIEAKEASLLKKENPVHDVKATRQVVQLRTQRLSVITERIQRRAENDKGKYQIDYKFNVTQEKGKEPGAVSADARNKQIRLNNPDTPSVTLAQFSRADLNYSQVMRGAYMYIPNYVGLLTGWIVPQLKLDKESLKETPVISAKWDGTGDQTLVTLLVPQKNKDDMPIKEIKDMTSDTVTGFQVVMNNGSEILYQAASKSGSTLKAGNVSGQGEAILLVKDKDSTSGIALGVKSFKVDGKVVETASPDFEFTLDTRSTLVATPILRPVDPVRFGPDDNNFADSTEVTMTSDTPDVDIYYTLDCSDPVPGQAGTLNYLKPFTINKDKFIKARAYRKGVKKVPFTIDGTKVSEVSYGWFYKKDYLPALAQQPEGLKTGLNFEYVEDNWFRLFSHLNLPEVMPAKKKGEVTELLDVSMRETDGPFGIRYNGYIDIPNDGLYTFYGPTEYVDHIAEPGSDLRLYIDGKEWYLGQLNHGHGKWSVPLKNGLHKFAITFADARAKDIDHQRRDLWGGYPSPWVVWRGKAPVIEMSGPDIKKQPIPAAWLRK